MKRELDVLNSYGGFWIRVLANLIDTLIITIPIVFIIFVVLLTQGEAFENIQRGYVEEDSLNGLFLGLQLFSILAVALYFAAFESSYLKATPGKIVLGLMVTDIYGEQLSFPYALVRYLSKMLSNILFIGYIMVAFTERKRGLHDYIAGSVVLRRW